jgi:apolipoprotein N-acyltransferase
MVIALKSKWLPAIISGLLMTAAFPKVGLSGLAWLALVPLLVSLRGQRPKNAFRTGMIAGLTHYLTLLYWVVFTMRTYGYLPWWQCVSLLVLLAAYLAVYPGLFALMVTRFCRKPGQLVLVAPVLWVALEYIRSFLFTGFPWGIVGYSQFNRLHIIQISDMFGVYGISFLVVFFNAAVYVLLLFLAGKHWHGQPVGRWQALKAFVTPLLLIGSCLAYGSMRIGDMDEAMRGAASPRMAVVQGNIDQARKWDPAFQIAVPPKIRGLTLSAAARQPDLVVWPETATPFYFEASPKLTRLVNRCRSGRRASTCSWEVPALRGHRQSRLFQQRLHGGAGRPSTGRYDKVHLVPFGEYVPLKRSCRLLGKMVAQVGDFSSGEKGRTLDWGAQNPPLACRSVLRSFSRGFPGHW